MYLILTDETSRVAPGVMLLSPEFFAEVVEFVNSADDNPARAAQLLRAPVDQATELLFAWRDALTGKEKLPPVELTLHNINEALKALGRG